MTNSSAFDHLSKEEQELLSEYINETIKENKKVVYTGAEAWKDVKKTAVITTTALLGIVLFPA